MHISLLECKFNGARRVCAHRIILRCKKEGTEMWKRRIEEEETTGRVNGWMKRDGRWRMKLVWGRRREGRADRRQLYVTLETVQHTGIARRVLKSRRNFIPGTLMHIHESEREEPETTPQNVDANTCTLEIRVHVL